MLYALGLNLRCFSYYSSDSIKKRKKDRKGCTLAFNPRSLPLLICLYAFNLSFIQFLQISLIKHPVFVRPTPMTATFTKPLSSSPLLLLLFCLEKILPPALVKANDLKILNSRCESILEITEYSSFFEKIIVL